MILYETGRLDLFFFTDYVVNNKILIIKKMIFKNIFFQFCSPVPLEKIKNAEGLENISIIGNFVLICTFYSKQKKTYITLSKTYYI